MSSAQEKGGSPLYTANVRFTRTVEESKEINSHRFPAVIISANGMATGGRIVHHLMQRLPDSRNSVAFVGYQAVGTRGRYLVEGAKTIKIYGREYPVRAQIHSVDGFSAHGDYNEILRWLSAFKQPPRRTFLVHGEPRAIVAMREHILAKFPSWSVAVPKYKESFDL